MESSLFDVFVLRMYYNEYIEELQQGMWIFTVPAYRIDCFHIKMQLLANEIRVTFDMNSHAHSFNLWNFHSTIAI